MEFGINSYVLDKKRASYIIFHNDITCSSLKKFSYKRIYFLCSPSLLAELAAPPPLPIAAIKGAIPMPAPPA